VMHFVKVFDFFDEVFRLDDTAEFTDVRGRVLLLDVGVGAVCVEECSCEVIAPHRQVLLYLVLVLAADNLWTYLPEFLRVEVLDLSIQHFELQVDVVRLHQVNYVSHFYSELLNTIRIRILITYKILQFAYCTRKMFRTLKIAIQASIRS